MHDDAPVISNSRSRFWNGVVTALALFAAWGAWRVIDHPAIDHPAKDTKQALWDADSSDIERLQSAEAWAMLGPSAVPKLTAALTESDPKVRQYAALALGRVGTDAKEAAPALMKLLDDEHPDVRTNAAFALGHIKQDIGNLSHRMVHWLSDADANQRSAAASTLLMIGSAAIPAICEATESEIPETRRQAALILQKLRTRDAIAITAVRRLLTDDDDSVREQAYEYLAATYAMTFEDFTRALRDKNRAIVILATTCQLSDFGEDAITVLPDLARLIEGDDAELRSWAIWNVGSLGTTAQSTVPVLIKALDDESYRIRADAIRALKSVGAEPDVMVPLLTKLLANIDPSQPGSHELAGVAARLLVALKPDAAKSFVPLFIKQLQDKDSDVRQFAAWTLASLGEEADAAVPTLIETLKDDDVTVAWSAAYAIGEIGSNANAAVPALIRALKHVNSSVSEYAAEALGKFGPEAKVAVPALIRALKHVNPSVRESAAEALGKIGPEAKAAVPKLVELFRGEESDLVWEAVAAALKQIDPDAVP